MIHAALIAIVLAAPLVAATPVEARPKDVADFIDRSESCYYWLGEPPYDKARAAEIRKNVAEACTDLPRRLARLKKRHAHDTAVMALLKKFDPANGLADEFPGD